MVVFKTQSGLNILCLSNRVCLVYIIILSSKSSQKICYITGEESKVCGTKITGRNTTNAKKHLQALHKPVYEELVAKENALNAQKSTRATAKPALSGPGLVENKITTFWQSSKSKSNINTWGPSSSQAIQRDDSLVDLVIHAGIPVNVTQTLCFKAFCRTLDSKYVPPSTKKLNKLFDRRYQMVHANLLDSLKRARKISMGMDIWTKKGYTSSYLAITACYFDPKTHKSSHALLNLYSISHPHTGDMISDKFNQCLQEWEVNRKKVFLIITDNGSNMSKAVKVLNESVANEFENEQMEEESGSDEESVEGSAVIAPHAPAVRSAMNELDEDDGSAEEEDDDESTVPVIFEPSFHYKRLACVVHTLQLVVRSLDKCVTFSNAVTKARTLVRAVRASSVATQRLLQLSNNTLITDCPTRWSSCFLMLKRLTALQSSVKQVCDEAGIDALLASEWTKLEGIVKLLAPFAEHTNTLQTDTSSLSSVLPVIYDLDSHLADPLLNKDMVKVLSTALGTRFSIYISPENAVFDPLPAAACLLSPDVAWILLESSRQELLAAAKAHILALLHCDVPMEHDLPPAAIGSPATQLPVLPEQSEPSEVRVVAVD